jgi:hypothetical protein
MNPLDQYSVLQPLVQKDIDNSIEKYASDRKYDVAQIPAHTHTGVESNKVDFENLDSRSRYILYRVIDKVTSLTTGTSVGGSIIMPFNGFLVDVGATVDTAGSTGTMTINVLNNGVSVLLKDIYIDSGAKTSRTSTTDVIIDSSKKNFIVGDIFTFNVDTVQGTPALGLTYFLKVIEVKS